MTTIRAKIRVQEIKVSVQNEDQKMPHSQTTKVAWERDYNAMVSPFQLQHPFG